MKAIEATSTQASLPTIMAVLACDDHGPCDGEPTAVCPHCGAFGRYVYTFLCSDGSTRGAMKGCIKLFPKSRAAKQCEAALSKRGQNLSSWDKRMLEAIEKFRTGLMNQQGLEQMADAITREKKAWIKKRFYN